MCGGASYTGYDDGGGGGMIQPCWEKRGCNIAYLFSLWLVVVVGKQVLQCVNSRICIVVFGLGLNGGLMFGGTPIRHSMFKCRQLG